MYRSQKHQGVQRVVMESGSRFENEDDCSVLEFFFFIFSFKKSSYNPQGLIRLSNNSVLQAMYK